jgi:RimJ/RimL family protein N-acetyltransferase
MINPFLIGKLVYLRPLERSDAPLLVEWVNDPEVTKTILMFEAKNLQQEEQFIDQANGPDGLGLGIVIKENDKLIGIAGLRPINWRNRHAMFGMLIGDRAEWGKGYATETTALMVRHAFQTLNLNRVWLHVQENNAPARRAYEKAGFQVEGRLRQDTFRDGRYLDCTVMGLLRDEWEDRVGR